MPSDHRLAGRTEPIRLEALVGESFVTPPGSSATRALEFACESMGERPRVVVETDNSESLKRLVEHGLGIALPPKVVTRGAQRYAVLPLASRMTRQLAVIHRGDEYLTAAARALKQELAERLRAIA